MARKPKAEDPEQSKRFIEKARKLQIDDRADGEFSRALDVLLAKSVKPGSKSDRSKSRKRG